MTAFAPSQIPTWVNTVEKLAAWSATILAELNSSSTVVINPGVSEIAAQATDFRFNSDPTNVNRFAVILYIPLASSYRASAPMRGVQEMSGATIPTTYTT